MPGRCSVYGCNSNCDTQSSTVSAFSFPKDPELFKVWTLFLRRENFVPSKYARICCLHFLPSDFVQSPIPYERPRLKTGAVPSIFCPTASTTVPAYLQT